MGFAPIGTERLLLRRLRTEDAAAVLRYRSLPEVSRFQRFEPRTLAEAEAFLRGGAEVPEIPGTWFQLGIELRATGKLVGDCGLGFPAQGRGQAELGITVAPAHQRRGLAAEALRALLRLGFEALRAHRLSASIDPANHASIRLVERVGMRREAHLVESLWFKGRWVDDVIYAMLDREWRARGDG